MTHPSWPYLPHQCPHCYYFQAEPRPLVDDSGYEIPGACGHPRLGMELFRTKTRDVSGERCPLFVARSALGRDHG